MKDKKREMFEPRCHRLVAGAKGHSYRERCKIHTMRNNIENSGENVIEWVSFQKHATLTISQSKYVHLLERLAETNPDDVQIIARNKDGTICVHLPLQYIQIRRPWQYSEDQRKAMAARFHKDYPDSQQKGGDKTS